MKSANANGRGRARLRAILFLSPVLLLWLNPVHAYAQRVVMSPQRRGHEFDRLDLERRADEPTAKKPVPKKSEIPCDILQWKTDSPVPTLTLVCPPRPIFAPLRVYLVFSWRRAEDLPKDFAGIVAEPGNLTKLQLRNPVARIWLKVRKNGTDTKEEWIPFNYLQGLQLQAE